MTTTQIDTDAADAPRPGAATLSDRPDEHRMVRRAMPWLAGSRSRILGSAAVTAAAAGCGVAGLNAIGTVTDAIIAADLPGALRGAGLFAVFALTGWVLSAWGSYLVVAVGERVVRTLREAAASRVAHAELRFLETHRRGDLLRRMTGEIANLSDFVGSTLPELLSSAVLLVVTIGLLVSYSWPLAVVLLATAVLSAALLGAAFARRASATYQEVAAAEAGMSATVAEVVAAREQIAMLGARRRVVARLAQDNRRLLAARMTEVRTDRWLSGLGPAGGLTVIVVLLFAGWGVQQQLLSVGGAMVFLFASRSAFSDIETLVLDIGELRAARTSLARVFALLESTCPTVTDGVPLVRGALEVEDVGYSYRPGRDALRGVTLRLDPGERVALVGPTGSGKSTLAKILAGLYRPHTGRVLLGGTDVAAASTRDRERQLVLVPQEVVLTTGSIADNLALAPGVSMDAAGRAHAQRIARRLGLADWLDRLATGLDTPVGENGSALSAGERQLVALLRVALLDPSVLILDEATAEVDPVTAGRIERALGELSHDRVVVVIAHRPDSIGRAPRRISLVDGVVTVG
ncbi:MAG: ABC transporter ATP-binding protein [Micropruina sp.]|uniref:ABC transporter ATP-binding protein n=1 Tax=Micropruina sp. TaxID=2737536 RepID=UPI0039E38C57